MALTPNDVIVSDLETFLNNHSEAVDTDLTADIRLKSVSAIVSDDILNIFQNVLDLWINSIIAHIGIVNNILTITCFTKMGFKETANISMTAVAIWDLARCILLASVRWRGIASLISVTVGLSWGNIGALALNYLAMIGTGASGALAAYVSVERCLCISLPFTVKFLLTRKSVTVTCVTISFLVICSYVVVYSTFEYVTLPHPETNGTFLMFSLTEVAARIQIYIFAMSVFYPVATFFVSCVCTVITVYHLKKASRFRSAIQPEGTNQLSLRDRQVIKMLVVVVIVYIICTVPKVVHYMTLNLVPEFDVGKSYNNIFWISLYVAGSSSLVDASINLYIFYTMSSQFKQTLRQIVHLPLSKSK